MSLEPGNHSPQEFLFQQPIAVDLQSPIQKLFPSFSAKFPEFAEQLQQGLNNGLRNVMALPIFENNRPRLTFRSADTTNRSIVDLPYHEDSYYLVNVTREEAHRALFLQRNQSGKASKALLYDTVLDKPGEFRADSDEIADYVSHLHEMVAKDAHLVIQLTDRQDESHNQKVIDVLKTRFGQPIIRPYVTTDTHPTNGKLLIYRKGSDAFIVPDPHADTSERLPSGEEAAELADEFLRFRRLVGARRD